MSPHDASDGGRPKKLRLAVVVVLWAEEFACGPKPLIDGDRWSGFPGIDEEFDTNPRYLVAAWFRELVHLWIACRSGMGGLAHLPGERGALEQSNWLMEAFEIIADQAARLAKVKRGDDSTS